MDECIVFGFLLGSVCLNATEFFLFDALKQSIAIFLPSLCGGGAERVMVYLANGLIDRGFAVDVVLSSATGSYLSELSSDVTVVDLGKSRVLLSLPGLTDYLRKHKPLALLSSMGHANLIALMANRLARGATRIVLSEHNNALVEATQVNGLRAKAVRYLSRYFYQYADGIVAVSHGVASAAAKQYSLPINSIEVIYNPVVTPRVLELAQSVVSYPWLSTARRPIILAAGRLMPQKNFSLLISAFAILRKSVDACLVIIGEGQLRLSLERQIEEANLQDVVLLPGFVDNPFAVMKHADLFVLSSDWEGLPTVLIEAMACGTPVVSTDCPSGPDEILEGGKWGWLVPVGDIQALAQAMLDALAALQYPDAAGRALSFNIDQAIDRYLSVLLPSS